MSAASFLLALPLSRSSGPRLYVSSMLPGLMVRSVEGVAQEPEKLERPLRAVNASLAVSSAPFPH
jgi:hypothetical protein